MGAPVVIGAFEMVKGLWLVAERPADQSLAGYLEFPGGKVEEEDKTEELALDREWYEELGCRPLNQYCLDSTYLYNDSYGWWHAIYYVVPKVVGLPRPRLGQRLKLVTLATLLDENVAVTEMTRDLAFALWGDK